MSRSAWILACLACATLFGPSPARADLLGPLPDRSPVVDIARSTMAGGLTGLSLGLSIAILTNDDAEGEVIANCYAVGTIIGFVVGLYRATPHDDRPALIEFDAHGAHASIPLPEPGRDGALRLRLAGARF
jgi:hypothetical protein